MNKKRAFLIGVAAYVASFVLGVIAALILGIDLSDASAVPPSLWYVGMINVVIVGLVFSWWYFKTQQPSAQQGFYLGLVFIAVGFVLDTVLIVPLLLTTDVPSDVLAYYSSIFFVVILVLLVLSTTLMGWWLEQNTGKQKKKSKKRK